VRRRFLRNRLAVAGLVIVAAMTLTAVLAPWISPYSPYAQFTDLGLQPPSRAHLLGTDTLGRDYLSRLLYGARISLLVGVSTMIVAALAGVFLGLVAGYYGKLADALIGRLLDALLAFPVVLLAIFIVAVLGPSMLNAIVAVAIVYTPTFARLTRASVLSLRAQDFVEAARAMGASDGRIIGRHVLPNTLSPLIVQCSLGVGSAILIEASLSFLGLGVQPPTPSWGAMIGSGRGFLTVAPHLAAVPGVAIVLAIIGFNLFGDGVRDMIDPRTAGAGGRP
jgi:peptide/nickel transport system permease protein